MACSDGRLGSLHPPSKVEVEREEATVGGGGFRVAVDGGFHRDSPELKVEVAVEGGFHRDSPDRVL